ncbi:unnamed protein product [Alternaria alternata]
MDPLLAAADAAAAASDATRTPPSSPPCAETPPASRLWGISDIHLSFKGNREALEKLLPHPHDDLILCGDVGESAEHCRIAFTKVKECFRQVFWVPGNHELYTLPSEKDHGARGEAKYMECVAIAREYGILTPEDGYTLWEGEGGPCLIAPIFTLGGRHRKPTDEHLLHPDPYSSRIEWCNALLDKTEKKPLAAPEDLVKLFRVPRFSLWCGTKKTEDWHNKYNAKIVVSGHLHIRRTDWIDDTRFEEVSLGYPRQWHDCQERGLDINDMLRELMPGPDTPPKDQRNTVWRQFG